MRINKYIAQAGICSRRKADELIANGNAKINGAALKEPGLRSCGRRPRRSERQADKCKAETGICAHQ